MIHFKQLEYWVDRGYIKGGSRVMDVGTQNLLFATFEQSVAMIEKLRTRKVTIEEENAVHRLCVSSAARSAFLHGILSMTDVHYQSVDIFSGEFTTPFDLNADAAPSSWQCEFYAVLNIGTVEHVINQANAFRFIHDVLKVGGVWIEQSPSIGYLNHGYFQYHPQLYSDLAAANGYEIVEAWYSKAGAYPTIDTNYALIDLSKLESQEERDRIATGANELPSEQRTSCYNFNAVIRKMNDDPFRFPLESRTSCGGVSPDIAGSYGR